MTANRDGDFYILQGEKSPVSLATQADFTIIFAKTEPEAQAGGITSFLVPLDLPGITKLPIPNMGLSAVYSALLKFDKVRIPATNLIGRERDAFHINNSLGPSGEFSQVFCGIISLGAAQSALSQAISYAKQRIAFGKPIAQFQAISNTIAEDATLIEMARWLCYRTLWLKDQGLANTKEAAMCSWSCPKSAYKIIEDALLIHGHAGYTDDYPFQQMLRDIIAFELIGGTENIMKLVIAEKVIGKIAIPDELKSHLT
jgi:cyclohexanecarboxyl-CoA dehydrogenase